MTTPNLARRTGLGLALFPIVLFVMGLAGCEDAQARLTAVQSTAATAGRIQAGNELVAAFDDRRITFEDALIHAETLLAEEAPEAAAFAGAVLDLAQTIESRLPAGPEHELFWRRVGQLAYRAAFAEAQRHRWPQAASLVRAGPDRWQREPYWLAYPNHDMLVAACMGHAGDPQAGIARLRSRPVLSDEMGHAIDQLRELQRQQLRERIRDGVEAQLGAGGG